MALLAGSLLLVWTATAEAAFPGQNGKIAFQRLNSGSMYEVWVMEADGSDPVYLTNGRDPAWSPDGTRIAFARGADIWVINADGTGEQQLVTDGPTFYPTWSPLGDRLTFGVADGAFGNWIGVVNDDGTGYQNLCCGSFDNPGPQRPDWSPDGTYIAFSAQDSTGIWRLAKEKPDGSGYTTLASSSLQYFTPSWAPDGTKIVFAVSGTSGLPSIGVMNADGSAKQTLVSDGFDPNWQPLPVNAYPRPKGASPTDVSLVPAYEPCTTPNRTHGPPLAFDSCNPPAQTPGQLTVGTPDANGQPAKLRAHVRINPLRGNPSTSADEADVRLRASVNDVRLRSDLSDYTGALELRLALQITDKDNTPHPGGPGPATVQEFTHSQPLPCSTTPADATVGSTCQFDTTVEAVVPGAVKELTRGIWELKRIAVHDGAGNLFLTQGIFVP